MERRYNPRTHLSSSVLIFHRRMGCIKGVVKNISRHGMFIDTGECALPKGSVIELAGPASWKLEGRTGLPKGLIIHSKDGKVGLMLTAESGEIVELSGLSTTTVQKKHRIQEAV
jgi:hypothetical protein